MFRVLSLLLTLIFLFCTFQGNILLGPRSVKPDLYYEKSATCVATSFATGETPVAGCRKLSQRLMAKVEPGSTFATACIATWGATCIATWETQVASWALANHVCFPLVVYTCSCPYAYPVLAHSRTQRKHIFLCRLYSSLSFSVVLLTSTRALQLEAVSCC